MNKTTTIRARIEPSLKNEVERILSHLGLTVSETIHMFYRQIKLRRGLPFEVALRPHFNLSNATLEEIEERYKDRIPNKTTIKTLNESMKKSKKFKTPEALYKDLGI